MAVSPNVVLLVLTWPLPGLDSVSQSTTIERRMNTYMYHVSYLLSMVTRQMFHDRGVRLSEQCIPWREEKAMFIIIALM